MKLEKDEDGFDRPTPLHIKSSNVSPNKLPSSSTILNSVAMAANNNNGNNGLGLTL